jgi:predicted Zn finger-like uncharacterized protein
LNDADLRYGFTCPNCAGSFSISLAKIPPVQARFNCPKCGKAMDFPSREEARVYISLQSGGASVAVAAAPEPIPAATPPRESARPAPPPREAARPTPPPPAPPEMTDGTQSGKSYRIQKRGYDTDVFDRRALRQLIRSQLVNETDLVAADGGIAARADSIPELKSLFELRKSARAVPPPVCPAHIDRIAHYKCGDTGRPLCEECADEKKFGGTSVRVCAHCGGTAADLHEAPGDIA